VNAVKPGNTSDGRVQRNRAAKASRYVQHFYAKMREAGVANPEADKAALEEALTIVREASSEQWEKLAEEMTKENRKAGISKKEKAPSPDTFVEIVHILQRAIENVHLQLCRCGAVRDDPTDRDCRKCQLKDLGDYISNADGVRDTELAGRDEAAARSAR
jgi:hypothetical protein